MSEQGLAARALAGARLLVPSVRRRAAAPTPPVRTVADLVRDRAESAVLPGASDAPEPPTAEAQQPASPSPARPLRREPAIMELLAVSRPVPLSAFGQAPVRHAAPGPAAPRSSAVDAPPWEVEPGEHAEPITEVAPVTEAEPIAAAEPIAEIDPAAGTGPVTIVASTVTPQPLAPMLPAVRTQAADAALAPPWVRAALMGVDLRDPAPTDEQAAAGRALRRTFGAPRDPGRVILASVGAPTTGMITSATDSSPASARRSSVGLREASRPPSRTAPVHVRVLRRDAGVVAGAEVTLLDGLGVTVASGVAGPDGRRTLAMPYPGAYMLVAASPGYQPGALALHAADRTAEVEVLLVRSAAVSGTVRTNEHPVPAAQITLVQDGEVVDMVVTDTSGNYRLDDLTGGEYAVAVAADRCPPAVTVLVVPEESHLSYDIDLAAPSGPPAVP